MSVPRRLLLWTFVCCGSAVPSFLVGHSLFGRVEHTIAMLLGIAVFIAGYTWATGTDRFRRLRRNQYMRRALFTGFTTRIVITIIYPVGLFLDLMCGMLSVGFAEMLPIPEQHAATVFITTIVQGTVLNFVIGLYVLTIYGLQRLFGGKLPAPGTFCEKCRYDLRASSGVCPECGTAMVVPFPSPAERAA